MDPVKKFTDVFRNMPLSRATVNEFASSEVRQIKVWRKTKRMDIRLVHSRIVKEDSISLFSRELKEQFPFIDDVHVHVQYNLGNIGLEKAVARYWENVLHSVALLSPVCHKALEGSSYELSGNRLSIKISNSSLLLFMQRGIDKKIQDMLDDGLGAGIQVIFEKCDKPPKRKDRRLEVEAAINAAFESSSDEQIDDSTIQMRKITTTTGYKLRGDKPIKKTKRTAIQIDPELSGDPLMLSEELNIGDEILVQGEIFAYELRETRSGRNLISFDMTDGTNSLTVKFFIDPEKYTDEYKALIRTGNRILVRGQVQYDDYSREINMMASVLCPCAEAEEKQDTAAVKRVELHLHTQMSAMDGMTAAKDYIKRAEKWGHRAIAITDHGVVQAFPEVMDACEKTSVKPIYGIEAYLVDDLGAVVQGSRGQMLDDVFVVFDLETTGFSKDRDQIIEIGAVKIQGGEKIGEFSCFVNPQMKIPAEIVKLTGITDDNVKNADLIDKVLPEFLEFIGDSVLVAHNAAFDVGFVTAVAKAMDIDITNTVLDTVELSRTLFPELTKHKLNVVAEHLGVKLENHHRAVDDAMATAEIFIKCTEILADKGVRDLVGINVLASEFIDKKKLKYYHAIILVKNRTGLRNLYELVSKSHIDYFARRPRIPKSEYLKLREGLIIGTACEAGEFYKAVLNRKPDNVIEELASFYDYFEIQPSGNNMYLVREGTVGSEDELKEINRKIVSYGEQFNKPVVATCDVHFIDPEGEVYRRIIMAGEGFEDADLQAPLYFRTTDEMLAEFEYLGCETAYRVVVENTNLIADMIEPIKPIPDETFPPKLDGAEDEILQIATDKAKELYGDPLPKLVADRLERELNSIIKNGFSVMYIIAQKLVSKSLEDGYLVGSRGSVGSSFAATMAGITEVNPLPPHYLCPSCKYSDFDSEVPRQFAGASGCDMPDAKCPVCGASLNKDGHDIPFETFLGFDGDKEPDIDLNFSGEYQAKAHAYTEQLFGEGHVFKAGTIGTLADKTAYGYVCKYFEERLQSVRNAEINRIKTGCTGIKRTTGQHPGGLMIVPNGHSIYEFCPIQRPANDTGSNITTTHFDYHSISGRLLKLDILGHDVPTIIRMLHDTSGIDPRTVDLGDKTVLSLFTSPESLGVSERDIRCKTGTLGLPEFGTPFVRQMLLDTRPSTFSELVRISGLSHGTDVWFNNAQELIKDKVATLKEVIPTRDDIMVYLINKGVEKKAAFKIMENVRKGKGLTGEEEETMMNANVPEWYIESCRRIKYMFPKGHAVAYVMMTIRIAYFKIHHPYSFYAASFSVKFDDFDYGLMCSGKEVVIHELDRIAALGKDASAKEKNTHTMLELVLEMYARGLQFSPLKLYEAEAAKFKVMKDGLMPPLCSIPGLGLNVAQNIVESRTEGEFFTIEDFRERTKTNKTVVELLKRHNILDGIPETNQLTLFM